MGSLTQDQFVIFQSPHCFRSQFRMLYQTIIGFCEVVLPRIDPLSWIAQLFGVESVLIRMFQIER
jgi:hypothetical protein